MADFYNIVNKLLSVTGFGAMYWRSADVFSFGGFVIGSTSSDNYSIYAQHFDNNGITSVDKYTVTTGSNTITYLSVITLVTSNKVAFIWQETSGTTIYIKGAIYNSDGTNLVAATTLVSGSTAGTSEVYLQPVASKLLSGKICIAWKHRVSGESLYDGAFERYLDTLVSDGSLTVFYDSSGTGLSVGDIDMCAMPGGTANAYFMITYVRNGGTYLSFVIYNSTSVVASGDVYGGSGESLQNIHIMKLSGGDAVIAWERHVSTSSWNVFFRRYTNTGSAVTVATQYNSGTGKYTITYTSGAALADNYYMLWYRDVANAIGVGKQYNSSDSLVQTISSLPSVSLSTTYTVSSIVVLANGDLAVLYYDSSLLNYYVDMWREVGGKIVGVTYTGTNVTTLGNVTVRAYRDSDGVLVASATSDANGNFTVYVPVDDTYTVVGDLSGHVAGIIDNITPEPIT